MHMSQVQGLGPIFHLTVTVQNTSPTSPVTGHYITFKCDESLYLISRKFIQVRQPWTALAGQLSLSLSNSHWAVQYLNSPTA